MASRNHRVFKPRAAAPTRRMEQAHAEKQRAAAKAGRDAARAARVSDLLRRIEQRLVRREMAAEE